MTFSYPILSEEEAEKERQFKLLEEGTYNFEVLDATFKMSNTGPNRNPNKESNPMIELKLLVWDHDGKEHTVFDYLIMTGKMIWKTIHFCKCVGLEEEYLNNKFSPELCYNKTGKVLIKRQAGQKKSDGTYYKDKNVADDYIVVTNATPSNDSKKDEFNDDITF